MLDRSGGSFALGPGILRVGRHANRASRRPGPTGGEGLRCVADLCDNPTVRGPAEKVDLFDDPPWTTAPPPRRCLSPLVALAVCILGSGGVAISTMLPWYQSGEASPGFSATSQYLTGSSLHPGMPAFGYLVLAMSCFFLVLASIDWVVVRWRAQPVANVVMWLTAGVAISAAALLLLVILEAHARPPWGDSPPLSSGWGAAVGLIASVTSLVGAAWALTVCVLDRMGLRVQATA
jgi:hypothetical protein